jgi:hypothetical protein
MAGAQAGVADGAIRRYSVRLFATLISGVTE